jgi:hypothetical protein
MYSLGFSVLSWGYPGPSPPYHYDVGKRGIQDLNYDGFIYTIPKYKRTELEHVQGLRNDTRKSRIANGYGFDPVLVERRKVASMKLTIT